jgi:succinate dehydrogenase / fumarate reductase iron-sulfur subunit
MTCGCCLEVCPQVTPISAFMGAAAISQVRLFNMHPIGRMNARERLDALMGEGGLADCANAQNCVHACPKEIPLTESIAAMGREMTRHMLKRLLGG